MSSPLRPELYHRLTYHFGSVIIAHKGEEMVADVVTDTCSRKPRLVVQNRGECYRVCCPFCNDKRHRLWINHRWGLYVGELQSDNLFLAYCFNEQCLKKPGRARSLLNLVSDRFIRGQQADPVRRGERPSDPPGVYEPPGDTQLVHTLPSDHPAARYLRDRGYDPQVLGQALNVAYCHEPQPKFHLARNRIIVPISFRGALVGWQARYVGAPPDKDTPKYFTMPGMKKTHIVYNYDWACKSQFVVVCEGVTDVWSLGKEAVAIFGKKISGPQTRLIASTWGQGTVVILLDGDAIDEAQEIYDALGASVRNKVIVTLPPDKDPGDFSSPALRRFVFDRVRRESIELPMTDMTPLS